MKDAPAWSCDSSCDSERATVAACSTGAGALFAGATAAAWWAAKHNEQCEAGVGCFARSLCTCTACTNPNPTITSASSTASDACSGVRLIWRISFITTELPIVYLKFRRSPRPEESTEEPFRPIILTRYQPPKFGKVAPENDAESPRLGAG